MQQRSCVKSGFDFVGCVWYRKSSGLQERLVEAVGCVCGRRSEELWHISQLACLGLTAPSDSLNSSRLYHSRPDCLALSPSLSPFSWFFSVCGGISRMQKLKVPLLRTTSYQRFPLLSRE